MAEKTMRILVPLDCSQQAQDTAAYVGGVLAGAQAEVVLFHVVAKLPTSLYDLGSIYVLPNKFYEMTSWEQQVTREAEQALGQARETLLAAGLPAEAVTTVVHDQQEGVTRDILAECAQGYQAVVLGRKGLSPLKDLVLGSTASKMVSSVQGMPVWVVGGRPEAQSFLLGVDGSEGCLRAAEYLAGQIARRQEAKVRLVNVVRSLGLQFSLADGGVTAVEAEEAWRQGAQEEGEQALDRAQEVLNKAGVEPSRISRKVVVGAASRASVLVEEAGRSGCGTIILGRRGISKIEAFFMGRVTSKVVSLAKSQAVWIVH